MPIKQLCWPEEFGFSLFGDGPSFIVAVKSRSIAEESGLKPGDQILQVNDDDVEKWSAKKIKEFVSQTPLPPPSLGVVSRLKTVTLPHLSSRHKHFGLTLIGSIPVIVSQVEVGSPAYYANIKSNDIVVKVSDKYVSSSLQARQLLDECKGVGKALVGVVSVPAVHQTKSTINKVQLKNNKESNVLESSGQLKAKEFLEEVKKSFGNHPGEVQKIVSSIQDYSSRKDIEKLASDMSSSFIHADCGASLIEALRYFIPPHHKALYNLYIEKYWAGNTKQVHMKNLQEKMTINCSIAPPSGMCNVAVQHDSGKNSYYECVRSLSIYRGNKPFGVTVCGHSPVVVQAVDEGSPADDAGIKDGDSILALNGIDIRTVPHSKAVALIQGSGSMPTLVIQTTTGALPQPASNLPCHPSLYTSKSTTSNTNYFASSPIYNEHYIATGHLTTESRLKPVCAKADIDWTSKFVPESFMIQGRTFKEQVSLLLTDDQAMTLKNGFVEFANNRNIDSLLFQLYPILSGSDNTREVIWQYVLQCLNSREKERLKRRLYDLTDIRLSDFSETSTENSSLVDKQDVVTSSKLDTSSSTSQETKGVGKRNRRRRSLKSPVAGTSENKKVPAATTNNIKQTDFPSNSPFNSTPSKHPRRRRTVGNINFSPKELTQENHNANFISKVSGTASEQAASTGVISTSKRAIDNLFYDDQQQAERRKRRDLAACRRKRSDGVAVSKDQQQSVRLTTTKAFMPQSTVNDYPTQKYGAQGRTMSEGTILRRDRRRSRKTVETVTSTTAQELHVVQQRQPDCTSFGDKKKKNKSDLTPAKVETASALPTSSIDDALTDGSLTQNYDRFDANNSTEQQEKLNGINSRVSDIDSQKTGIKLDNDETKTDEQRFFRQDSVDHASERSSNFNSIFLDDSKQKSGYFNAIKKRLTFSRPPKNKDTDTFLCELSAQFDDKMNLVDDIEIIEDDKQDLKYGEKWSYLPKSEPKDVENMNIISDFLDEVNLGNDINLNDSINTPNNAESTCKISFNQHSNTVAVSNNKNNQNNQDIVPPFPINLDNFEPTVAAPTPESLVASVPPDAETHNRAERVKRRRRRNAAKKSEENSIITNVGDESSIRRIPDPLPAIASVAPISSPSFQDDKLIYDVPKPTVTATQRRAHVNVEKRSRRSRANRNGSAGKKRNSTELRMHVLTENDFTNSNQTDAGNVKLRSPSPVDQSSFFERAKKKNYRVSGISMAMDDIFSEAEEDLHEHSFTAPRNSPPLPAELENDAQKSDIPDPNEIYAPLHKEALAIGLQYDEHEDEETQYQSPQTSSVGINTVTDPSVVPPAPPLPPPPPPPPPISPPLMFKNTPLTSPTKMSVKRINWEKIEPVDLGNTVWGQLGEDHDTINDVVKYLDLEEHFAMKRAKNLNLRPVEVNKNALSILAHKKAYNVSILLAHLKLTHRQICDCLFITGNEAVRKRMEASHYKQLLMYAPDQEELANLQNFKGDVRKLNEADVLGLKLANIPGYHLRLKSLVFKHSFTEKEEEIQKNLGVIQRASMQLRKSKKLAKILEFVLAMGNYMNRGHIRISKATGFRIHFLAEMDSTKTSDNKLTFLHILARAVLTKFPDVVTFADEIVDVKHAARVVYPQVLEELQELRKVWLNIRDNLHETTSKNKQDRFKIAMETCLVRTNGSIKGLEQLHNATVKEFHKVAQYFGENPKNLGMQQFFKIFEEFTRKFTKSYGEIRKFVKSKPSGR